MSNIHEVIQAYIPEGLSTPEERWETFQQIFITLRDMPFSCKKPANRTRTLNEYIEDFLARKEGTCTSKHLFLGLACESIGMGVKYLTYRFYWQNLPVKYPNMFRELLKGMPEQFHTALAVSPNNEDQSKHYLIDCTWDQSLTPAGFPVNSLRDAPHHCDLGVIPHTLPILHHSAIEQWTYLQKIKSAMPLNKSVPLFYDKFDEWLTSFRPLLTSCDQQDDNSSPNVVYLLSTAAAQF